MIHVDTAMHKGRRADKTKRSELNIQGEQRRLESRTWEAGGSHPKQGPWTSSITWGLGRETDSQASSGPAESKTVDGVFQVILLIRHTQV